MLRPAAKVAKRDGGACFPRPWLIGGPVGSDGTIRIKATSGSSLRKALGKKLDFSVFLPKSAAKTKQTLSLKFNW